MCKEPHERARLYFLLAWFHASIQERLRYAPLGWTKKYEFNESDLKMACDTLDTWLDSVAQVLEFVCVCVCGGGGGKKRKTKGLKVYFVYVSLIRGPAGGDTLTYFLCVQICWGWFGGGIKSWFV